MHWRRSDSTLNGDLGSCASVRHVAFTDVGQAVLADHLKEAIRDPHNDDALEQIAEPVKDLHEDEVLEQLNAMSPGGFRRLARSTVEPLVGPGDIEVVEAARG